MDKALQTAVMTMAKGRGSHKMEDEEEEGGGEEGEEVKWIHEFVSTTLPGSRHQVHVRVLWLAVGVYVSLYSIYMYIRIYRASFSPFYSCFFFH